MEGNDKTKKGLGLSGSQIASAYFAMSFINLPVVILLVVVLVLSFSDELPFLKFAGTCILLGLVVLVFRLITVSKLGWLRCRYWADEECIIKRLPGCEEVRFQWVDLHSATCKGFVDEAGFARRLMTKLIDAFWIQPSIVLTFSGGRKMTLERIGIPRYWYQECICPIAGSGPPRNALCLLLANMVRQEISDMKMPKARLYVYAVIPGVTLYFVSIYMKKFLISPEEVGVFNILMLLGIVIAVIPAILVYGVSKLLRSKNSSMSDEELSGP